MEAIFVLDAKLDKNYGEFEIDESYFRAKRIKGKRGRGEAEILQVKLLPLAYLPVAIPYVGLLKRDDKVYVEIVKHYTKAQLMPIIQGKILEGSTINTDG